jgi:hypothetical protein
LTAQPCWIQADLAGEAIHVDFNRELRLRRAEPAKRPVRRRIRHRRPAVNADVIAAIRTAAVDDAAREDHGAERRVRAAVHDDVDVHGGDAAVAGDAGAVTDDRRMPLRRRQHVFDAVVEQFHRAPGLHREQRRMTGNHRRVFFLPAEAAASLGLNDTDVVVWETEQHLERAVHVVRTLHRAVERDACTAASGASGYGNDAVGLDVELLLMTHAVLAGDDDVGGREALVEAPLSIVIVLNVVGDASGS